MVSFCIYLKGTEELECDVEPENEKGEKENLCFLA